MDYWNFEYNRCRPGVESESPLVEHCAGADPFMVCPKWLDEKAFRAALSAVAKACPLWVPNFVFVRSLTPEIAYDPFPDQYGGDTLERLRSLLKCVTRVDLELPSGSLLQYKLSETTQAGLDSALSEFEGWWAEHVAPLTNRGDNKQTE